METKIMAGRRNAQSTTARGLRGWRRAWLFAAVLAGGCGTQPDTDSTLKPTDEPAPWVMTTYVIGVSQCNLADPWRVQMNDDLKTAARKFGDIRVFVKDAQDEPARQQTHIEEFIDAGVDVLIVSPGEPEPLTEPVAKAYRAGVPVIVLGSAVPGDKFTCFVESDMQAGKPSGGQEVIDVARRIFAGEKVGKRIVLDSRHVTSANAVRGGDAIE